MNNCCLLRILGTLPTLSQTAAEGHVPRALCQGGDSGWSMGTHSPALFAFQVPGHALTFAIAAPAPGLCCTPTGRAAK